LTISGKRLQRVVLSVIAVNPQKAQYKVRFTVKYNGGNSGLNNKVVYEGNLSRNEFHFSLPVDTDDVIHAKFTVLDEEGLILYDSLGAHYRVFPERKPDSIAKATNQSS
jgi:hypothetical protein